MTLSFQIDHLVCVCGGWGSVCFFSVILYFENKHYLISPPYSFWSDNDASRNENIRNWEHSHVDQSSSLFDILLVKELRCAVPFFFNIWDHRHQYGFIIICVWVSWWWMIICFFSRISEYVCRHTHNIHFGLNIDGTCRKTLLHWNNDGSHVRCWLNVWPAIILLLS